MDARDATTEPAEMQRGFVAVCRRTADASAFQLAVLVVILANAIVMGIETWPSLAGEWRTPLRAANLVAQALFVLEMIVRVAAHGRRPWRFFTDGWNSFDFGVVAFSLLPAAGPLAAVGRLARILRVARLVSRLPELRLIIGTMLRSIPSMGHVVMLLGLLLYVYGVVGSHLFGQADPAHWGNLGRAVHSLFVIITLEGWVEIMRASEAVGAWVWAYYASFIVVAVFVVMNLFIAVVINNLETVRREDSLEEADDPAADPVAAEIKRLRTQIEELRRDLGGNRERAPEG